MISDNNILKSAVGDYCQTFEYTIIGHFVYFKFTTQKVYDASLNEEDVYYFHKDMSYRVQKKISNKIKLGYGYDTEATIDNVELVGGYLTVEGSLPISVRAIENIIAFEHQGFMLKRDWKNSALYELVLKPKSE